MDIGVGLAAVGKAGLVGHTVGGRRCNWQEEPRTALGAGHMPENQLAVVISLCQLIQSG